ncbi:mannose-6-phosphate isomerase, class I [Leucobacter sp. GX0328]
MLIFIKNTPRTYAWGSRNAIPELLGEQPTGEPQAELWLGTHPGSPASVAKATHDPHTLIDLVDSDPELYGVRGGPLPFLLKVLAIEAPLSLQVHPDIEQAREGFAREEAAGVPRDASGRNYGDPNHKPELLVALTPLSALSGFRPISEVRDDLRGLERRARALGDEAGAAGLAHAVSLLHGVGAEAARDACMDWAFGDDPRVQAALAAIEAVVGADAAGDGEAAGQEHAREAPAPGAERLDALRSLACTYPGDPALIISLLLHLVLLQPGEAVYLGARQLHAYLGGVGVEVMAASDNVLRAGFTGKHVDIAELRRILDLGELVEPRFSGTAVARGVCAWQPAIPDFRLVRARLFDIEATRPGRTLPGSAEEVVLDAEYPLVLIATSGRVRVERLEAEFAEVASVRRGQSLYISAGSSIRLTGEGEVFLATVGVEAE